MAATPRKKSAAPKKAAKPKAAKKQEDDDEVDRLIRHADALATAGEALGNNIISSVKEENRGLRSILKGSLAMVILLALMLVALLYRSLFVTGPILDKLDHSNQGIDSLVEFVQDVKRDQARSCGEDVDPVDCPSETEKAVTLIINLLCSSDDPVRQAACREIDK